MTEHSAQVAELLAGYRRSRDQLAEAQRELAAVTESASSAEGLVTATVNARGVLTGLVIADEAYQRYRPAELAREIVRVSAAATVRALRGAADVLAPALPDGTDPQALLLGTGDLAATEVTAMGAAAAAAAADDDESLEDQSWLEEAR
ncbi:YbaB/EbfC DNA-binding family protein [Amycolatopsis arida]|uniref:YbaB/EbfC DNA-binding family protein n=1 Tax=Amycolatopsis arida TaxID=587909 RepID=A0A1I5WNT5_9PSEU|nr:YbaB/EbfC family nucleoid-associated protein [Amycolatopsis arida]TDX92372.1 YbaB/EbfC DNA-binding family protein [Amycolatopsis arida]SFQ21379.1 YbaB/EbfC DNA-binding family protein [Amycolatopsis arida]